MHLYYCILFVDTFIMLNITYQHIMQQQFWCFHRRFWVFSVREKMKTQRSQPVRRIWCHIKRMTTMSACFIINAWFSRHLKYFSSFFSFFHTAKCYTIFSSDWWIEIQTAWSFLDLKTILVPIIVVVFFCIFYLLGLCDDQEYYLSLYRFEYYNHIHFVGDFFFISNNLFHGFVWGTRIYAMVVCY